MTYHNSFRYVVAMLLATWALALMGANVDELIQSFDKTQNVATANAVFRQLDKEQFTDELLAFKPATNADTLRQQVWYWAAEWYYDQQQFELARDYGLKALPHCKTGNNRVVEGDCENLLGAIFIRLSDYKNAAIHAKACYELDRRGGDSDLMSSSLNTLAKIYMGARQPREAEKYILQAIDNAKKAQNPTRMAVIYGTANEIYHSLGDEQKAYDYAKQAFDINMRQGDKSSAAMRQVGMASALLWLKRYDEAKSNLDAAIPQLRADGNLPSLGIALNQMGGVMLQTKRPAEAVKYYREAADIFVKLKDYYNESHTRLGLYNALKDSDPKAAMAEMERYKALKDSIYSSETAESLGRNSAELENNELQLENEAQRTSTRNAILIGVAVALVLLALGVLVWWIMRRRNKRQNDINEQLSSNIDELREQYRQLHLNYDAAMATTSGKHEGESLNDVDKDFLESTVNVVNELIGDGQIDAATVAERLNLSPYQFRQRLSAITGNTPQAFIQVIRMRRARHLLDNHPELSVSDVSRLCAYNDTPNFTRAFKNAFGITPSQYLTNR